MTIFLAMSAAVLAAGSHGSAKEGTTPSILVNPDTVITAATVDLDRLEDAAEAAIAMGGGHFGIAVRDFSTGRGFVKTEGGTFDIGSPELILAAMAIDLDAAGTVPLDTLSSRHETLADQVIMAREGDLEATMRIGERMDDAGIAEWLSRKGLSSTTYSGTQLLWPGAPAIDPNISTPADCMELLAIVEGRLDDPDVRRLARNPFTRTPLEDLQTGSAPIYGFSSRGEGGRCRAAVVALSAGRTIGIVVLADQLSNPDLADMAFRMVWEALR
ncbi:hypothetical protein GX411_10590 [Candidatus Fermentibacteria bacterium]|nr:hypothetical protein [Candidatus Fermentibacteria bacterium]